MSSGASRLVCTRLCRGVRSVEMVTQPGHYLLRHAGCMSVTRMEMEELQVGKGTRVRTRTGWQSMTAGAVADAHRSSANPDSFEAAGVAPRPPSRQHADPGEARKSVLKRNKERDMSRLAGRYRYSPISVEHRHPRSTDTALRPEGGLSVDTNRGRADGSRGQQVDAGTTDGWMAGRHDWLVPMELL